MTDVIESHIRGNFTGFKQHAQFQLANGQVWEQESTDCYYHHHHGAKVTIWADGDHGMLEAEGIPNQVQVRRLR